MIQSHNKGDKVSSEWLLDDRGNPTTDPRYGVVEPFGALRTFGWAAVLGEVMAVTTVLLVLPAAMAPAVEEGADASSLTTPAGS